MIVMMTDFGLDDPYVGIMKGVIRRISPATEIIDLCHGIPPQQIRIGCLVLSRSMDYFPDGTIFLAVVDPGVGTDRKGIAIQCGPYYLIGPDNGLFSFVDEQRFPGYRMVELDDPDWYRTRYPDSTFHGRDIFAPAAAWLDKGTKFHQLGSPHTDLIRLDFPAARYDDSGRLRVPLLMIDHFGNLIFALNRSEWMEQMGGKRVEIRYRGRRIGEPADCYASGIGEEGELMALFNSDQWLELAVRNGSAASLVGIESIDGQELAVVPIDKSKE
ncbi:MAG: SAM-dependent chlorinase/fluorinase [Candidatus Delongbacteria bacterium]|nr:SAM-dependent chlorinase/fluorinase [Candidatus Delongbacteria bacterium]